MYLVNYYMFHNLLVYMCLGYLVERVVPGNRVSIMGIYSIKKVSQGKPKRYDCPFSYIL